MGIKIENTKKPPVQLESLKEGQTLLYKNNYYIVTVLSDEVLENVRGGVKFYDMVSNPRIAVNLLTGESELFEDDIYVNIIDLIMKEKE